MTQSGPNTAKNLVLIGGVYSVSNQVFALAGGATVTITGDSDVVTAATNTDIVTIGGNGASGGLDSLYASGDKITVQTNSNVALYGASNRVTIGAKTELTMIGNGNKLSGGTDYVIINGGTGTTYAG